MPRTYVRKTDRGNVSQLALDKAVQDVISGKLTLGKAAANFNIPRTTIYDHVKSFKEGNKKRRIHCGKYPVFGPDFEKELNTYSVQMGKLFYGITPMTLRCLAFDLAENNNLKHPFNKEQKAAGRDWLRGFLSRHNRLSIRQPEATSLSRAVGFNKQEVKFFYDNLENVFNEKQFTADLIYIADETGFSTVHKLDKVIASKGQKQVSKITSAERGQTITVLACFSAAGTYVPPLVQQGHSRPFNSQLFSDDDFEPLHALLPNKPLEADKQPDRAENAADNSDNAIPRIVSEPIAITGCSTATTVPPYSDDFNLQNSSHESCPDTEADGVTSASTSRRVTVFEISPLGLPQAAAPDPTKTKKGRRKQHSQVISNTPMKAVLQAKEQKKQNMLLRKTQKSLPSKPVKRKLAMSSKPAARPTRPRLRPTDRTRPTSSSTPSAARPTKTDRPTTVYLCIYCQEEYTEPPSEDWIQCLHCQLWCHEACTELERVTSAACVHPM